MQSRVNTAIHVLQAQLADTVETENRKIYEDAIELLQSRTMTKLCNSRVSDNNVDELMNTFSEFTIINPYRKDDVIVLYSGVIGLVTEPGCIIYRGVVYSSVSAFILAVKGSSEKTVPSSIRNMVQFVYNGYISTWASDDIRKARADKATKGNQLAKIYKYMRNRDTKKKTKKI
jgi:CRISPR/Cas system CSM-associated protein Csm2 small subunit